MKGLLQDLLNTASFGRALSQQVPITNDFLVRSETLCPLPLLCPGILSGLSLCRGCAPCCSLCEFTCVPALLCLDNTVFLGATHQLRLLRSFHLLLLTHSPVPGGEGVDKGILFRAECSKDACFLEVRCTSASNSSLGRWEDR